MLACRSVNWWTGQNTSCTWYAGYEEFPDLPHMPAHSRQSGRQNIIARTHTWQQCSVSISGAILTTKYGFNLRQNSPLNIRKQHGILWLHTRVCRACANRSAITEVGTLLKRHTLVPSPTIPQHYVAWLEKGRGNSLKLQPCQLLRPAITVRWNTRHVVTALKIAPT